MYLDKKRSYLLTFILFLVFLQGTHDNVIQEKLQVFIPRYEKKICRYSFWTFSQHKPFSLPKAISHFRSDIRLTWPVLVDSKICSPGTTDVAMSLHRVATVSSRSLPWWPWLRVLLHSAPQKVSQKQKKLENFSLAQIKNLSRRRRALEPVPESRLGG
jgi:hypothetical protein